MQSALRLVTFIKTEFLESGSLVWGVGQLLGSILCLTLNLWCVRLVALAIRIYCTIWRWVIATQLLGNARVCGQRVASRCNRHRSSRRCRCSRRNLSRVSQRFQLVKCFREAVNKWSLAQAESTILRTAGRTCAIWQKNLSWIEFEILYTNICICYIYIFVFEVWYDIWISNTYQFQLSEQLFRSDISLRSQDLF